MKITKLFPVALAAFALASCSNEESVFNNDALTNAKAYLTVDFNGQNGDDVTRGTWYISSQSNNTPGFTQGDKIRVYDSELTKYDMFTYLADGNKFATNDDNINKQYAYATYPAESFSYAGWSTAGVQAVVEINKNSYATGEESASYTLKKENKVSGAAAWTNIAPMWGTAEANDETNVKTTLNLLTAVLKVQLSGIAPDNCKWIKVIADKDETEKAPLSGYFDVTLASGAMLKKSSNKAFADYYSNEIVIALPADYEGDYIAYIPVIAGVEYKTLAIYTGKADDYDTDLNDPKTELLYQYTNKTFETKFYSSNLLKSFSASASLNPNEVSLMITDKINNGMSAIYVKGTQVTVGENTIDNTIYLPNTNGKDVWLDFDAIEATTHTLNITNKAGEEFTGTLAIKVGTAGNGSDVNINLPNAKNVVLVGDWTHVDGGSDPDKKIIITDANKLTFGEAGMTTAITPSQLIITNIRSTDADAVLVAQDATVNVALELNAANAENNTSNKAPLTISGTLALGATVFNNVVVNTPADGIAIPANKTLTVSDTKTVTLKQGYIGTIAVGADNKTVTIEMPADQGTAAVKTLTTTAKRKINFNGTATWDGTTTALTNVAEFIGENIYTATQLKNLPLALAADASYTLQNDIDLNGKTWPGLAKTGNYTLTLNGNNKKISNLKNDTYAVETGAGLFASIAGTALTTIKDLTIQNVTLTAKADKAAKNIGALAGVVTSPLTANNVKVTGTMAFGSVKTTASKNNKDVVNVGGIIGNASANTTLNECTIDGAARIAGESALGGLVGIFGSAANDGNTNVKLTIDYCFVINGATFAQVDEYNSLGSNTTGFSNKSNMVGLFVGTIADDATEDGSGVNEVEVISFEASENIAGTTFDKSSIYGQFGKLKLTKSGKTDKAAKFYGDKNGLIGRIVSTYETPVFILGGSTLTKAAAPTWDAPEYAANQRRNYFNQYVLDATAY